MRFVRVKSFLKKKINRFEIVLIASFTYTTSLKAISSTPIKTYKLFSLAPNSQKLLSDKLRDLWDSMPRHWSLCVLLSPCYLQDAMPWHWSSSDLPRVLRIWESVFYSQTFFTLHSFLLFQGFPGAGIASARLFVWITTIHKRVILVGLFKAYGWSSTWRICLLRDFNSFHYKLSMSKASCFIRFVTELYGFR